MADVLVIGAGVSGLACAHDLAAAGTDVLVAESAPRPGGVIGTHESQGFRFETGPNTIQAGSGAFRELCGELEIADELVVSRPEARLRYLFHRGRLRPLPMGPWAFLSSPLLSTGAKLRVLSEPFRRRIRLGDEAREPTFEAFLEERVGSEATRVLAGAFVRGVYAAEVEELGARSAFPRLWRLAEDHGGLMRGMLAARKARRAAQGGGAGEAAPDPPGPAARRSDLLSFPAGLGRFVDALAGVLGERLRLGSPVRRLSRAGTCWRATLGGGGGETFDVDTVVLALPARPTAELLAGVVPAGLDLAPLEQLPHAAVTLVHLGLEGVSLPPGFGFLVPPDEEGKSGGVPRALGMLFVSNIFEGRAPAGAAAVTAVYHSARIEGGQEAFVRTALEDLRRATGEGPDPEVRVALTQSWRDVIPRYGVGHDRRMAALRGELTRELPGLVLAGTYVDGVSVEDCVARGRRIARALLERRSVAREGVA